MYNKETANKLRSMRMSYMAEAYKAQLQDNSFNELTFDERIGLLVDSEWSRRKNNRLAKLIKNACFQQPTASIENIEYHADRKLDKTLILKLATGNYIAEAHNVIIMGASGAGKTYLACAFGNAACRKSYTTRYIRLPELLSDLALARGDGSYKQLMKQYQKIRLLILDEWLLTALDEIQARDLLEIVESRHKQCSTIFCSQFAVAGWHGKIGEGTIADAILDRIIHDSYTISIDGLESMRKRKGINI